ncbi:MAG: NAD(+) synthase [Mycoplasmataceae bacterium]|nr:NAD(+) synthase [Mycoplasmataceae bacterium]MBR3347853.1 NAD(+) synthase [Mycoplasmataceae bacterium]
MKYLDQIINWIKDQVKKANCSGVAVGISGGIDSALVAYLAKKAFPNDSIGILIPINKKRQFDLEDGLELVKKLDLDYKVIDLSHEYQSMIDKMNVQLDLTKGNMQARLRMTTIYAFAQERNYLVLGTDNKAEYDLGYFTKWGDGGCDLLPIVNLYKSEVFEYAKKVGIPINIINKTPSAGLWDDQSDEKELGFTYDDYEQYDKNLLTDQQLIEKIKLQISKTNHKRIEIPKAPKRSE